MFCLSIVFSTDVNNQPVGRLAEFFPNLLQLPAFAGIFSCFRNFSGISEFLVILTQYLIKFYYFFIKFDDLRNLFQTYFGHFHGTFGNRKLIPGTPESLVKLNGSTVPSQDF